jgi:hypothetical protein
MQRFDLSEAGAQLLPLLLFLFLSCHSQSDHCVLCALSGRFHALYLWGADEQPLHYHSGYKQGDHYAPCALDGRSQALVDN